jgi:hypothetical protein
MRIDTVGRPPEENLLPSTLPSGEEQPETRAANIVSAINSPVKTDCFVIVFIIFSP